MVCSGFEPEVAGFYPNFIILICNQHCTIQEVNEVLLLSI